MQRSQANDADPQCTEFSQPRTVEAQQFNELPCLDVVCIDRSIVGHPYVRIDKDRERIWCSQTSLAQIAGHARIQEIVVVQSEIRAHGDWEEMVEREDAFERPPHFSNEAIHTSKDEFIP